MIQKTSIRYFNGTAVRAVWDEVNSTWQYAAVDIIKACVGSANPRVYWNALKKRNSQLSTFCIQLKLTAADGKRYSTDCLSQAGVDALLQILPNKYHANFSEWLTGKLNPLDEQSKTRAYELWDSPILDEALVGTIKGLQQIHAFLFSGLYDFAGKIRDKNISKGGFQFANCRYFDEIFAQVEAMPDETEAQIIEKYVELNIVHPFMEGNGRATRIWLDMLFKARLGKCVDWQQIDKKLYLRAMEESVLDSSHIKKLITGALTDKIDDRELFMKGIDYSYYYEEIEE